MQYSENDIIDIFCSSGQDFRVNRQDIVNIQYLVNEKLLIVERMLICKKANYLAQIDKIQKNQSKYLDFEGGGIGHIALKVIAQQYLIERGISLSDIMVESKFMGYRPDLMTKDHKILVECGNTETSKIFSYFRDSKVLELIIILYPDNDNTDIIAYSFKPSDDLAEFLKFYESHKVKENNTLR